MAVNGDGGRNGVILTHPASPPPSYQQSLYNHTHIDSHYAARLVAINALNEYNDRQSLTSLTGSATLCSRYPASQNLWVKYNVWARTLIGARPYRQFIPRHGASGRYAMNFVTPASIVADNTRVQVRALQLSEHCDVVDLIVASFCC